MPPRPSRIRRIALAAACAIVAAVCVAPPGQAQLLGPLPYVALGDSYSAASGVLPPDPRRRRVPRSTANYPHVIAAHDGAAAHRRDLRRRGDDDYFTSQYPGVAPQLDALTPDTQLVTMTIGGNDSGVFINAILDCGSAGLSTLGQGSPCKDQYGSSFEDTIRNTTYPSLVNALKAVRDKARDARVAILGYPWIMPAAGGCFRKMPVAEGDVPYLRGIQATLNDAVRRAAAAAGATYVDLNAVSEGHDACQPVGVRWVEPVLPGTNPVIVHPNALGEAAMAAQAISVLRLG